MKNEGHELKYNKDNLYYELKKLQSNTKSSDLKRGMKIELDKKFKEANYDSNIANELIEIIIDFSNDFFNYMENVRHHKKEVDEEYQKQINYLEKFLDIKTKRLEAIDTKIIEVINILNETKEQHNNNFENDKSFSEPKILTKFIHSILLKNNCEVLVPEIIKVYEIILPNIDIKEETVISQVK